MPGKNQVTLTFAGDSEKLERSFDQVGKASQDMEQQVGQAGAAFDRASEASDVAEGRFQGMASTLTGTKDTAAGLGMVMSGNLFEGMVMTGQGAADLAEGFNYTVIPMAKMLATTVAHTAANAAHAASMAVVRTATGAWTAAQWLLNAALTANPIGLVIVAVAALVAGLIVAWKTSETFRRVVTGAFDAVIGFVRRNWPLLLAILTGPIGLAVLAIAKHKDTILGFFRAMPGAIAGFFAGLAGIITAPFRAAVNGIRSFWNSTLGGKGFTAPSWVPGIGGKGFHIPRLHGGGVVPGAPGQEVLAILQAGEHVSRSGSGGSVIVNVSGVVGDGPAVARAIRAELLKLQANGVRLGFATP